MSGRARARLEALERERAGQAPRLPELPAAERAELEADLAELRTRAAAEGVPVMAVIRSDMCEDVRTWRAEGEPEDEALGLVRHMEREGFPAQTVAWLEAIVRDVYAEPA